MDVKGFWSTSLNIGARPVDGDSTLNPINYSTTKQIVQQRNTALDVHYDQYIPNIVFPLEV